MFFQRAVTVFAMALTTLAQSVMASPSVCVVYTVVESAFPIEACFTVNSIISIESVTPVSVTNAPTCITTIVTASTTLSEPDSSATLLSGAASTESIQVTNTMAAIIAPATDGTLSTTELSFLALSTPVAITTSASVRVPTTIVTSTPVAAPITTTSSIPPSSTCSVPPPEVTQDGTTPYCCQWYIVQPGDTCDYITSTLNITAGSIYKLNPELLADCYNLALGNAYCVSGSPQIVPAPALFYIVAHDSDTVADGTALMGGHSDHVPMGFNMINGQEPLTFTYDPVTGFLQSEGYYVYITQMAGPGPLTLVTFIPSDALLTPGVIPLVCTVTLAQKLYCSADGLPYNQMFLFSYQGQTDLGLNTGVGTHIAAVDLFLESA